MRRLFTSLLPVAALLSIACTSKAQNETAHAVAGGGISVTGWTGQIGANEAGRGQTLSNAKLANDGNSLHVTTGPAVAYWNPANTASGDYTVKASFNEPQYMNVNWIGPAIMAAGTDELQQRRRLGRIAHVVTRPWLQVSGSLRYRYENAANTSSVITSCMVLSWAAE